MLSLYPLQIVLCDGEGKIIASQPYSEYQYGDRDWKLAFHTHGKKLGEILIGETGTIRFDDEKNKWIFAQVLTSDPEVSAMRLLGKIAEAVIVRECRDNPEVNFLFFKKARRSEVKKKTANKFYAIGTGLYTTKNKHPKLYNPSDPQRDVIWVNQDGKPALMAGSNELAGFYAGLQVKASTNGIKYVLPDLLTYRYEVPVIYFPIANDFEQIIEKTYIDKQSNKQIEFPDVGKDFIDVRTLSSDVFEEVKSHLPLVKALMRGELKPEDIVKQTLDNPVLRNAVMSDALNNASAQKLTGEKAAITQRIIY